MRTIIINNPGPQGAVGPQGTVGPSGSTQPFSNVSGSIWATTSSLQVTGSFIVSGSSTFTNIGPAVFSGSVNATSGVTMSSAVVSGDVTVLGTASINVLQINTTINSTGSNTLGDNANDTQTLYGSVVIPTGSLTVSGSAGVNGTLTVNNKLSVFSNPSGTFLYSAEELFIGTSVNRRLAFFINSLEAMRIAPTTRNLLIGTTIDAGAKLHISGSTSEALLVASSSAGPALFVSGSGNVGIGTASPAYQLSLAGSANIQGVGGINLLVGTRGVFFGLTGGTEVSTYLATSPLIFSLNQGSTAVARFAATTGNFLIGTTTDSGFKLDVSGSGRFTNGLTITGSITASGNVVAASYLGDPNVQFGLNPSSGVNTYIRLENTGLVPNGILFNTNNASNSFKFKHDTNYTFTLGYQNTSAAWFGSNASLITVNASAQVQIDSTTKGFLPPRTNTTASISSPAQGLMTYLTGSTDEGLYYYNSGSQVGWHRVLTNTGSQSITGSLNISGVTTFANGSSVNGSGNLSIGAFSIHNAFGYATFSATTLLLTGGTFTSTSGTQTGLSFTGGFTPTSGTATYSAYSILPTINQTGGANGITRGLYVNPTLTAAADFRAIETTSGSVIFNHGATSLMFISSSGNVGIGTNVPAYALDVRTTSGFIVSAFKSQFAATGYIGTDNSTIWIGRGTDGFNSAFVASSNLLIFRANNSQVGEFWSTGNLTIQTGGTYTDDGYKLDVKGSTRVRGSGATSSTTALRVENANASASMVVLDNGFVGINTGSAQYNLDVNGTARIQGNVDIKSVSAPTIITLGGFNELPAIRLINTNNVISVDSNNVMNFAVGNGVKANHLLIYGNSNLPNTSTTGEANGIVANIGFAPTSGTASFNLLNLSNTINQTGGANGITRGLYVNPTLTSAANFRAIETTSGSVLFSHGATTLMSISSSGNVGINTTASSAYVLDVNGTARTGILTCGTINPGTTTNVSGMTVYQGTIDPSTNYDVRLVVPTAAKGVVISQDYSFLSSASALLEVKSTTKGFLPPRMTNAQRVAISTPAVGLMVYCTDATEGLYIYKSAGWTFIV